MPVGSEMPLQKTASGYAAHVATRTGQESKNWFDRSYIRFQTLV